MDDENQIDDKLKRKRELTKERVKKHRKKKRTESEQLNSLMQVQELTEEMQNKQAERKRALAKERSRRYRERKRRTSINHQSVHSLLHDSQIPGLLDGIPSLVSINQRTTMHDSQIPESSYGIPPLVSINQRTTVYNSQIPEPFDGIPPLVLINQQTKIPDQINGTSTNKSIPLVCNDSVNLNHIGENLLSPLNEGNQSDGFYFVPLEDQVCASPTLNAQFNRSSASYSSYARHSSAHIDISETSMNSKETSQSYKLKYDPSKKYANDSSEEQLSRIKVEADDSDDDNETDDATPNTEKVFVNSILDKRKQSKDGQSRPKRSRLDTTEGQDGYEDKLYEFGKYVAEQLLCLNVEDARVAQMYIVAVLSNFTTKKEGADIVPKQGKGSYIVTNEAKSFNSVVPSLTSISQVNTAMQPKFLIVSPAGKSVSQTSQTKVIIRPSVSQTSQMDIPVPSANLPAQLNTGSSLLKPVMIKPASSQLTVMNMKPGSTSGAQPGYIVVPTTGSGLNIVRLGNTGRTLVTQPGSGICFGSTVTQPSPIMISGGSLANGSSSMAFPEISAKTKHDSGYNTYGGSTMTQSSFNLVSTKSLVSQTGSSNVESPKISVKTEPESEFGTFSTNIDNIGSQVSHKGSSRVEFPVISVKTEPKSGTSIQPIVTLSSTNTSIVSTGSLVSQTGSSSVEFPEIPVKIEPEFE